MSNTKERKAETIAISYLVPDDKNMLDELDENKKMLQELKALTDSWVERGYIKRFMIAPPCDIEESDTTPGKKSDGVHDVVKWLEQKCKEQKKVVELARKHYETDLDWAKLSDLTEADFSEKEFKEAKIKLDVLVSIKASIEKYFKKLRYDNL